MALDLSPAGAAGLDTAAETRPAGLIGPNSVLQTETALIEAGGPALARAVFARAELGALLEERPSAMIDEQIPRALFDALFDLLPRDQALAVAHRAGRLTGAYILAHRIPRFAQAILKLLPGRLAAPILLAAVRKHAWTFAGSGVCTTAPGRPATLEIAGNPLAMPGCVWHAGVLETLFETLVSPRAVVRHTRCGHDGAHACRFEIAV
ncbi:MAG: bacteriochlorophyll 4-vinyl reductase [Oceanicaulis sp.]